MLTTNQCAPQVFEWSSGILAITIRFLAEQLSFCTKSELERPILSFKNMLLVQNTLVMYTCACAPIGPP
eukprot:5053680-Heterocapsa_arctica.AAC.1